MKQNTRTLHAFNIDYDFDDDGNPVDGPKELSFKVWEGFDPETELADLISDETGFLVNGYNFSWTK